MMKINPIQLDKIYSSIMTENTLSGAKDARKQGDAGGKDNLVLSSTAKEYSEMDRIVSMVVGEATKASSSEKLLRLKNEISQGTYYVSAEAIAEAMIYGNQ